MLETKCLKTQFCVIGGGIAGICAAIAAARHGTKVVLMHERPMLGGNASSEIRMWISGAGADNTETGILEEIVIENNYRNPTKNYHIWDTILFDFVKREENITLLLNCTCMDASVSQGDYAYGRNIRINSVTGYQMTTQRFFKVEADYFADCSGDSILAPLTGAHFMLGRESKDDFGEDTHVKKKDSLTMGMTCCLQARETTHPVKYIPSERITKLNDEHFRYRTPNMRSEWENFWYLELGGDRDSIGDTEELRDELIALALGTWDYIKNSGHFPCENFDLEYLGFLPGKRESRRMTGEYVLTSTDILSDRLFPDTVAFGGWPLDDHYPSGFYYDGTPNTDFKTPAPYCIPYRSLYSINVDNLFFAGRNISTTHMALSTTRVMLTCGLIGQAVGTAASIAVKYALAPHGVYRERLDELQETLMRDDSFLPHFSRKISDACKNAAFTGSDNLRDGIDRVNRIYQNTECGESVANGTTLTYTLAVPEAVDHVHIVFDSNLHRETKPGGWCERTHHTRCNRFLDEPQFYVAPTLCKGYKVEAVLADGTNVVLGESECNLLRSVDLPMPGGDVSSISLTVFSNWGDTDTTRVYSFDFN